jgi:hypothetical protein
MKWMRFFALWILFSMIAGGKLWRFPLPIKMGWKKQVEWSVRHWDTSANSKRGRDKIVSRSNDSI